MRVFLDTNVIASATATRGLCADVLRSVVEFHELVVSEPLLMELARALRDKFGASDALIADTVWFLKQDTLMAAAEPLARMALKDQADVRMLSCAVNGGADVFVTGDKEILGLGRVGRLDVLSPRQFWEKLRT